jgi:hypothetical protein
MGGPPNPRCRIIWRADGSVKTPVDGFPYVPVPEEEPVPDDLPDLVPESEVEQDYMESEPTPLTKSGDQRGGRKVYDFFVICNDLLWGVTGDHMYPLRDFLNVVFRGV